MNKAAAFRALRKLIVYNPRRKYNNQLVLFFTSAPNLEVLEVLGQFSGIPTAAFLYAISSTSHNLKCLVVWCIVSSKAVFDVLPCFRKLQTLNLSYIDCHIPRSFLKDCASSMTSLQSLMINLENFHLTEDVGTPVSGGPLMALSPITFNSLSKLLLSGPPRDIENTLTILHVPQLVVLSLGLISRDDENFTDISPVIQTFLALNGPYLKDGLWTLSLKFDFTLLNMKDYLDSFQIFTKLDTFEILASNAFFPTSDLASFLHENNVWSNLTVLHLSHHCLEVNQNRLANALSIATLPLLADSFPNLLHLSITINNPDQDAMKEIAADNLRKAHSLESLRFEYSLPRDWIYSTSTAVTFVSFLHQLFPKLKTVESFRHEEWVMMVQELLREAQTT